MKTKRPNKSKISQVVRDSWSIDWAFMRWVYPRLKLFAERDVIVKTKKRQRELNYMVKVFGNSEAVLGLRYKRTMKQHVSQIKAEEKAIKLFAEHFHTLWD